MSDLAERLQILHACWTVNSGTTSGDKYADDLAEAMLENAEAIIAVLDSHAAQSAELAKLREEVQGLQFDNRHLRDGLKMFADNDEQLRAEAERLRCLLNEASFYIGVDVSSQRLLKRITAALGEQGQTGGASEHGN